MVGLFMIILCVFVLWVCMICASCFIYSLRVWFRRFCRCCFYVLCAGVWSSGRPRRHTGQAASTVWPSAGSRAMRHCGGILRKTLLVLRDDEAWTPVGRLDEASDCPLPMITVAKCRPRQARLRVAIGSAVVCGPPRQSASFGAVALPRRGAPPGMEP